MRKYGIVLAITLLLAMLLFASAAFAADNYYSLTALSQPAWEGTPASHLAQPSDSYNYAYGDDESVSFNLPWNFTFYGRSYNRITADTNGNIWFNATDAAYSFPLANTGRGPVIAAWNSDLSSSFYGGVFIQGYSDKVVIEWQTETYTDESLNLPNTFEVVLYPDGTIRFDYKTFSTESCADGAGSGISSGQSSGFTSLTAQYGNVYNLAGRSFVFSPQPLVTVSVAKAGLDNGSVTSEPAGITCGTTCSGSFPLGSTVVLSATRGFGSDFGSWSGACTGTDSCTLILDSAKDVTATFVESLIPDVVINAPSGIVGTNTPIIDYAASSGSVVVKIDNAEVNKVSGQPLDLLTDGSYILRVEATNSGGRTGFAESSFTVDTNPPGVTITPATGASNIPVRASILVQFSEQIDPSSVTAATLSLAANGVSIPGDVRLDADGKALILKPQAKLSYAGSYRVTLKAGVRDVLGNTIGTDITSTFTTPMIDPDLVGYWPMDGDWNDYSGSGNNGTAYGSSIFADGRVSGELSASFIIDSQYFEGSSGSVITPPQFIDVPDTFTMSFWAKPTATRETTEESSGSFVSGEGLQRFAIAPVNMFNLGYEGASAGVSVGTNGVSVFEETTINGVMGYMPSLLVYDSPTPLNDWTHIAVVYNNKQPSLYLNGVLVKTGLTSQRSNVYPAAVFGFGNERFTGSYGGQLAGIAYHKRALNSQEIQALYHGPNQAIPHVAITSPGQTFKYRPGEAGTATVAVTSTTAITKLYCSASGATTDGELVVNFDQPQTQVTQELGFHIAEDAAPYAPVGISCVAQTIEGLLGIGELQLQAADLFAPTVVSSIPLANATDVSATMPITITFSEAIDPSSIISRDTFKFQRIDNGDWVTGMFRMSTDKKAIQLVPSPALASDTAYTITLNGVRDLAGNALADPYVLQFTTLQKTTMLIENQGTSSSPYVLPTGRYGTLTLNNSVVSVIGGVTADTLAMDNSTLSVSPSASVPGDLSVAYGDATLTNNSIINVNGTLNLAANLRMTNSNMAVTGAGTVSGNVSLNTSSLTLKNPLQVAGDVDLSNNSILTHFAATMTDTSKLDITAANMTVDASSKVDVTGKGYLGGFEGTNTGKTGRTAGNLDGSTGSNGGSYGGIGGGTATSNAAYGDLLNPNELGSGGSGIIYDGDMIHLFNLHGGNGGGLVQLRVGSLLLNGIISADGSAGGIGGGSGGAIRIDAEEISGSGSVKSNGGSSTGSMYSSGGGGGGGRIAIYYRSSTLPGANISAAGGLGLVNTASSNGGAGTVYLKQKDDPAGRLMINNNGAVSNTKTAIAGSFNQLDIAAEVVVAGNYLLNGDKYFVNSQLSLNDLAGLQGNLFLITSTLTGSGNSNYSGNLMIDRSNVSLNGSINVTGQVGVIGSSVSIASTVNVGDTMALDGSNFSAGGNITVLDEVSLKNGSVLTHSATTTNFKYGLDITAGTVSIDSTSRIDVTGKGYLGGFQGGNTSINGMTVNFNVGSPKLAGGSYGGLGGYNSNVGPPSGMYGNIQQPTDVGSGGGAQANCTYACVGGNGGGSVKLTASTLDLSGSIMAEGGRGITGAGGSGGSIWLNVSTLSGNGVVSAKGGIGDYGGGGGGRIALYYTSNTFPLANLYASGGKGSSGTSPNYNGGAGIIYLKNSTQANGELIVNNEELSSSGITSVAGASYRKISVTGGAKITVAGDINFDEDVTLSNSSMAFSGGITTSDNLTFDGSNITVSGPIKIRNALVLKNGSVLSHNGTTTSVKYGLDVTAGTVSIDPTSKIDVTGKGYLGGFQGGNSTINGMTVGFTTGSQKLAGGSYAGLGGYSLLFPNSAYGNIQQPTDVGSGGGAQANCTYACFGGNGGGLVKLTANSLNLSGSIMAEGGRGITGAGGSGGSIWLNLGSLSGNGTVSVKGGVGDYSGGGGGRIAISYASNTLPVDNLHSSGGKGGSGSNARYNGGAGTIYLKETAQTSGVLYVNNEGLGASGITSIPGDNYHKVSVTGGAKISVVGDINFDQDVTLANSTMTFSGGIATSGSLTFDGSNITVNGPMNVAHLLTLKNGSVLSHTTASVSAQYGLNITAEAVSIDPTSKIDATSKGYLGAFQGSNNTVNGLTVGFKLGSPKLAGGSHGGLGGYNSYVGPPNGTYGSILQPFDFGSGGGGQTGSKNWLGGNGGGLIKIVAGSVTLNGSILADGGIGESSNGAGGSGGSIWLDIGTFSGSGIISAKGGAGSNGGGGGRIAAYYNNGLLPNNLLVTGGTGSSVGKPGTVYTSQNLIALMVNKSGNGTGVVESAPFGINCGSACSGNFPKTSTISLMAHPDSESIFTGWYGACSGTGTCTVTMDAAKDVSAGFDLAPVIQMSLSVNTIAADYKGTLGLTISGISPIGGEANVEQFVDIDGNGVIDGGDYAIRSFRVADGASGQINPDGDMSANGSITTALNFFLVTDIYHAPGTYVFRASRGLSSASVPFTVTTSLAPTVTGIVSDGMNPIAGAIIRVLDKNRRPVAHALSDALGAYTLTVNKLKGPYYVLAYKNGYGINRTTALATLGTGQQVTTHDILLTPGEFYLSGRLLKPDGTGISGVWMEAEGAIYTGATITTADGDFDLFLPGDRYEFPVVADITLPEPTSQGFVFSNKFVYPKQNTLSLYQNQTNVYVYASTADYTLFGRMADLSDVGVAGVVIKATSIDDFELLEAYGVTDGNGLFKMNARAGIWNISPNSTSVQPSYVGTVVPTYAVGYDGSLVSITAYPANCNIKGTVKDATNTPIPGITVKLWNADSSITSSTTTAYDGSFSLAAFAGTWFIDALTEESGYADTTETILTTAPGATIVNLVTNQ